MPKISVEIALEGGAEIERQLQGIGEEGEKAFQKITNAAAQVSGFKNLRPEQIQAITANLQTMGDTGVNAVNRINAAVTSAVRLENLVSTVASVETAFSRLGAAGNAALGRLDAAVGKIGVSLSRALGPLGGVVRALGPLTIPVAALGTGSVALIKFANSAEETSKALTELQKVSGISVSNLSAMANVFEQGGTSVKQFAGEMGNLSEKIAAAAQQRLIKQFGEHNEWVQWANDIRNVSQQFDGIAGGARGTFSPLTTLDTKLKAIVDSVAKAPAGDQFNKLADIFKNLASDLDRAQIGKALGLSPETIQTLSQGSAALKQAQQQVKDLGLALDNLDQKNLQQLIASQNQAGALFDALKTKIGALAAPAIASFWEGFTDRLRQLSPIFQQIAQQIGQLDFSRLGAAAADFLAIIAQVAAGWARILAGQTSISDVLSAALEQAGPVLLSLATTIGIAIGQGIIQGIASAIASGQDIIVNAIQNLLSTAAGGVPLPGGAPIGGPGGGIGSQASGGLIGGRGTGTSDSNLAWVSRGEHIMPARAVQQPGVLAFLEALRRSGGDLRRVLDGMGRFALGGLVPTPIPVFAGGGLNAGMSNVTIQFPGLAPISGLRASASTVDEIRHAAAMAQVRSGGRKPTRYT